MAKPQIGFIGLGAMGAPMAGRLLDAGFKVTSSVNKNREALEATVGSRHRRSKLSGRGRCCCRYLDAGRLG